MPGVGREMMGKFPATAPNDPGFLPISLSYFWRLHCGSILVMEGRMVERAGIPDLKALRPLKKIIAFTYLKEKQREAEKEKSSIFWFSP